jgi:hypothetical protein
MMRVSNCDAGVLKQNGMAYEWEMDRLFELLDWAQSYF